MFLSSPPLGGPKWLLLLLAYEKDDIGRGNGRTKHASGGMGDSGQLMDSSTIAEDRGGGLRTPERVRLNGHVCMFFLTMHTRVLDTSASIVSACFARCARIKPLFLDATPPRTNQFAVEDMWSERNPLLYFTSSFATQIQTSFSAWAPDANALCTGSRQVPALFFPFFPPDLIFRERLL